MTTAVRRPRATWAPWSPLQLIVTVLGGFLVILGVIALSRAGFASGFADWTEPKVLVWGFAHTPLMAIIELFLGFSMLWTATSPFSARTTLAALGALMAVFGAIVLLEPGVFGDLLGANRNMGLFYLSSGAGGVLLSALVPVVQ